MKFRFLYKNLFYLLLIVILAYITLKHFNVIEGYTKNQIQNKRSIISQTIGSGTDHGIRDGIGERCIVGVNCCTENDPSTGGDILVPCN